jgi:hypothetical protein
MALDEHAVLYVVGQTVVARLGTHVCRYDGSPEPDAIGVEEVVTLTAYHTSDTLRVRATMLTVVIADQSTQIRAPAPSALIDSLFSLIPIESSG